MSDRAEVGRTPREGDPSAKGGEAADSTSSEAARFALLYESRDKRLCLFEDAEGHLTSVDAKRLA